MNNKVFLPTLSGLLLSTAVVHASGFGVKLNSTQLQGQAYAGSGVSADPLAAFNNPAAAILTMNHELAVQATMVIPSIYFQDTKNNKESRQAGIITPVPGLGFTAKISENVRFNINTTSPYGLKFNYGNKYSDEPQNLRNYSIKAEMMSVNINPNIAVRLTDYLTVGAGFQALYTDILLQSAVPMQPNVSDGITAKISGNDWTYGWTAGVLLEPTRDLKVGLSYRSKMNATLNGKIKFTNPPSKFIPYDINNQPARAKIGLPDTYTISTSFAVTPQWTILADAILTNWQCIKEIIVNTPSSIIPLKSITQNWKKSWFFSLGSTYKVTDFLTLRTGVAVDKSPASNETRIPGIPDSDKVWVGFGATYTIDKHTSVSVSYGHERFKKGKINLDETLAQGVKAGELKGQTKAHVDLLSIQVNRKF